MAKRERGAGRVYLRQDPADPERRLQTYWIDYHVDGRRFRESSKSRKTRVHGPRIFRRADPCVIFGDSNRELYKEMLARMGL